MKQETRAIQCPKCGETLDVNAVLARRVEETLRRDYADKEETLQRDYEEKLDKALKEDRARIEQRLRKRIAGEHADRIKELERDLADQSGKVRELNKAQSTIERLKREKASLRAEIEVEVQREHTKQFDEERENYRKTVENEFQGKLAESEQVIARLQKDLQEASKKATPTAPELRGGAQEKIIADYLTNQFPLDTIERIGPGRRGADILQTVHASTRPECGVIYYESKNTQRFGSRWIETFKRNMLEKNATIGVLVTRTRPKGMDRLGLKEGIWICTLEEFKGLCFVLRESIIQLSEVARAQENRAGKMGELYDYLTGPDFRSQVEAIVSGFTKMKSDLEQERNAMQVTWGVRERRIRDVLLSTNRMYGSIKGIAGNSLQAVPLLELPSNDDTDS